MPIRWTNRADRRLWRAAVTFSDLAALTARWLEGDIRSHPGVMPNHGPDAETQPLIPLLAAANCVGFLTDSSQPGHDAADCDGILWEQRASVTGFVADPELLTRLVDAAEEAGLLLLVSFPDDYLQRGLVVTRVNGMDYTRFGRSWTRPELRGAWPSRLINETAFDTVARAAQLTIAAPEFGSSNTLWTVLDEALRLPSTTAR
ncbi:DUF6919 domain-containing protein [Streptomyces antarcticus]|uniref:DUF6919 domain-containing protein n=1 Tax=Streptomyces antarcticus TaxID=2996458 RepID=UPI00226ECFEF|nr:hypothetical protein [Streptomyces sp. H34-AA3]MCY0946298.1 hypothetical protein [Streptomyces sp. H34-AA3]